MTLNTTLIQSLYARGPGTTTSDPFITVFSERDPTTADVNYPIQKRWVNIPEAKEWMLISYTYDNSTGINVANWLLLSSQGSDLLTLTGNTGDVVTPLNGNIDVVGDGIYITTDGDDPTHTLTISLIQGSVIEGFVMQTGTTPVVPAANGLVTFNGSTVLAGNNPVRTNGTAANTMALEVQISQAIASTNVNNIGLSAFDSAHFTVDANGFVSLNGSGVGLTITGNTGGALPPTAGNWNIFGAAVAAGTTPVTTSGAGSTLTLNVQRSQAIGSTNASNVGLAAFSSSQFSVDANGFVTLVGGTTPALLTLSDDVNTIVSPSGTGNIQLVGHVNEQGATKFSTIVAGTNLLNINPMSSARWIVDPLGFNGTHTTLTSALASASSGDTIFIVAGSTLTENVTLKAGVNISAFTGDQLTPNVTIIGNLTASFAGSCSISNVRLQTNSAACLTVSGSSATIVNLYNTFINATNATAISFTSSSSSAMIRTVNCWGNLGTTGIAIFSSSSAGQLSINYSNFTNTGGSTTASTISAGSFIAFGSSFANPITSSGTAIIALQLSDVSTSAQNVTAFTNGGSGGATCNQCRFVSGSASAVSTSQTFTTALSTFESSNTNVITGSGTIVYTALSFAGTSSLMNVSNQTGRNIASGGITFDGGTNVLSNYTTGTFTPTLVGATTAGTTTYTSQDGFYTRIGNQVTIWVHIQGTGATGTGNAVLGNFPFTIKNQNNGSPVGGYVHTNGALWTWPASTTMAHALGVINTNTSFVFCNGSGNAGGILQMANDAFNMFFTLTYQI